MCEIIGVYVFMTVHSVKYHCSVVFAMESL